MFVAVPAVRLPLRQLRPVNRLEKRLSKLLQLIFAYAPDARQSIQRLRGGAGKFA